MNLLVSAIIPVYNGERFLREAVDTILKQNYRPLEIITVDDGSTDGTAELLESFGRQVRYIYQSNKGPAAARNKGFAAVRGEFIAFLDSDDLWASHKLSTQVPYLANDPNLDVIMGHTICFGPFSSTESELKSAHHSLLSDQLGSAVFRKSVFEKVGLFDEELSYSEDHDWFLRAREKRISMLILEEVVLYHRRHDHNMTDSPKAGGYYQLTKVLKKSLDRRRQNDDNPKSLPKLSDYVKKKAIK